MTQLKPYLFLERLVIISNEGNVSYDELFHHGINIIRGRNSSGKSTIANFIFYALGGDHYKWTDAANENREIFAQVDANGATLTLKRTISKSSGQSMSIFWGGYDESIKSNFEGWSHYPYKETSGKESFTNVIFNALEFPHFRTDSDNKITIHQLLRLIFIDQESPSQNLFRFERFDQPLTRQTVSEVLLGVYDDDLYKYRLQVKELDKTLSEKQLAMKSLIRVFDAAGTSTDIASLRKERIKAENELVEIETKITEAQQRKSVTLRKNSEPEILKLQEEFQSLKHNLINLTDSIRSVDIDIFDSEQFIESLSNRVAALNDSSRTKQILGELPLEFCPQCFRPLATHKVDATCVLCKTPFEENFEVTFAKRLRQEIQLQIKESTALLEKKKNASKDLTAKRAPLLERYRILQSSIDAESNRTPSTRDQTIDSLLVRKGNIQTTLVFLSEKIETLELLETLKLEIKRLQLQAAEIRSAIETKSKQQERNKALALERIQLITLKLLRSDLPLQKEFQEGTSVEVDFYGDVFSLDGHHNFSASSNVLLKNSVRFAIFFASLELPFFRYPRLIICDNMEDKGMEKERTQNFQRVVVEMSETYSVDHQIIFTTSMIADELDTPDYGVGHAYSETKKSLRDSPPT